FAAGVTIPAAGDLAPGESASVSATYVVTEVDVAAGKIYNVATATGQGPCPPDVAGESCPVTSPPDDATVTTEKPVTPEEPTKPEEPDTPDEPNTPDEPDTPDEPTKPEEPTTPEKPVEPTTPDEPAKPTTP